MKDKKTVFSKKIIIPLLALVIPVSVFSVGFAAWISEAGVTTHISGTFNVEAVSKNEIPVIQIQDTSIDAIQYAAGYGFLDDNNAYVDYTFLSGTCDFYAFNGRMAINTFLNNSLKSFKMDIIVSSKYSNGFLTENCLFTSDSIIISSLNFTTSDVDPIDGKEIRSSFVVECNDNQSDFTFDYQIKLIYSVKKTIVVNSQNVQVTDLTKFPDLAEADISVSFLLSEAE